MTRVAFLYDGLNLYHALKDAGIIDQHLNVDLLELPRRFLRRDQVLSSVSLFTAKSAWNDRVADEQSAIIRRWEASGLSVVLGRLKRHRRRCPHCHRSILTFEEKETDVKIAMSILEMAMDDVFDDMILVSGDSDLAPAVISTKSRFPEKRFGVLVPVGMKSETLRRAADFHIQMKHRHFRDIGRL